MTQVSDVAPGPLVLNNLKELFRFSAKKKKIIIIK
jgi:hypothetical protein